MSSCFGAKSKESDEDAENSRQSSNGGRLTLRFIRKKHKRTPNPMYNSRLTSDERATIQRRCIDTMKVCTVGVQDPQVQNGLDFYKYFFTNFPDLRVYFKGAEHFTPDDVQQSERFAKQGQRILLAVHLAVMVFTDDAVFQAFIRETVTRHRRFRMEPTLWNAFWSVWVGYLENKSKQSLDEPMRKAWTKFGDEFAGVARNFLCASGLPH